jgi:hypothetical protein
MRRAADESRQEEKGGQPVRREAIIRGQAKEGLKGK